MAFVIVIVGAIVIFVIAVIYYIIKGISDDKQATKQYEIDKIDALEMEEVAKKDGITILNLFYEGGHYEYSTLTTERTADHGILSPNYVTNVISTNLKNWCVGPNSALLINIRTELFLTETNVSQIRFSFEANYWLSYNNQKYIDDRVFARKTLILKPQNLSFARGYVKKEFQNIDFCAEGRFVVFLKSIDLVYLDGSTKHYNQLHIGKMEREYNFAKGYYKKYLPKYNQNQKEQIERVSSDIENNNLKKENNINKLENLVLPDDLTSINDCAYRLNSSLKSVILSDSVTSIGNKAFYGCTSLTSIVMSKNLTTIGEYAFDGCSSLKTISLPDSISSMGNCVFAECCQLVSIKLPKKLTSIPLKAFEDCTSLKSIIISNSVKNIYIDSFRNCISLKFIYYIGTRVQWKSIKIWEGNELNSATICFYSETKCIGTKYKYWHYVNDIPTLWS